MPLIAEQQAVAQHVSGHGKVVAVAGSGKTTTLVHRVSNLIQQGVAPKRVLVLMYNKSAQVDFRSRLQALHAGQTQPDVRTFHSLGLKIYKTLVDWGAVAAPSDWKPVSNGYVEALIARLLREALPESTLKELSSREFTEQLCQPMLAYLDYCKCRLQSPEQVFEQLGLTAGLRCFIDIQRRFEQQLQREGRITFADMLYRPVERLLRDPALAQRFANHMDYVLVDEYQDIDDVQAVLLRLIAGQRANVMCIGDPDQCIYSFRGAVVEHILEYFDRDYHPVKQFPLPYTFRYGHRLALAANHLISNNTGRADLLCLSHASTPDTRISLHVGDDEADAIIRQLRIHLSQGVNPQDVAIVVRLWAQSTQVELKLLEAGMLYRTESAGSVFKRRETQNLMQLLDWGSLDQADTTTRREWLMMVFNFPKLRIKRQQLELAAQKLAQTWGQGDVGKRLDNLALPDWATKQIAQRVELLTKLAGMTSAGALLQRYQYETKLLEKIEEDATTLEAGSQSELLVSALIQYAVRLQQSPTAVLARLQGLQQLQAQSLNCTSAITITTIHRCKGLEFSVVMLPGLTEKYMPYLPRNRGNAPVPGDEEAERRLLYVAITRAKHQLHLYCPASGASPFISEMQLEVADHYGKLFYGHPREVDGGRRLPGDLIKRYAVSQRIKLTHQPVQVKPRAAGRPNKKVVRYRKGTRLTHNKFGPGKISRMLEGRIEVTFSSGRVALFAESFVSKVFSFE